MRRASLSDRHNLCRKEYETEAIVWRGGREEQVEREKESDQENSQSVSRAAKTIVIGQHHCHWTAPLYVCRMKLQILDTLLFTI